MRLYLHDNEQKSLHRTITDAVKSFEDRKKNSSELRIITCYVDLDAVKMLIISLNKIIKLQTVSIIFEYMELFKQNRRPNDLAKELHDITNFCSSKKINFQSYPVRPKTLMHAKGYAIVQNSLSWQSSVSFISSGNATSRGLGLGASNLELSASTTTNVGLRAFCAIFDKIVGDFHKPIDQAIAEADEYAFRYAMSSSGVFLHKWTISSSSIIGIRYQLTPLGQQSIFEIQAEFREEIEKDNAITRQPLRRYGKLQDVVRRSLPKQFAKDYTIDTLLGRWCPYCFWDIVESKALGDVEFTKFCENIQDIVAEESLAKIVLLEGEFEDLLTSRGYVSVDHERIPRWRKRVSEFANDQNKLRRFYYDMEKFELPYEFLNQKEVDYLYDSFVSSISIRHNSSPVLGLVNFAMKHKDPKGLDIFEEDAERLLNCLNSKK